MRLFLFLLTFLGTAITASGQTFEETYPKTLWCPDTIIVKFNYTPTTYKYAVGEHEVVSPGTDARLNEYVMIYYGSDSLRLSYHNKLPYGQIIFVNFASPKGKTTLRFRFNKVASSFSAEYVEKNKGNIQFDIPETYELANIIWTLSPSGARANNLYKEGEYYKRIMAYFKPYLKHPIFSALDFPDSVYYSKYYNFRENSFAFNFQEPIRGSKNTKILFNGPYYLVYGNDEFADSSLFGKLKPMVEDFAAKSKFRQFYKNNLDYYQKEIQRQKELLPVKPMWTWLEEQFPKSKYQSYRIAFSPLIGASHSTQNYASFIKADLFRESVMFISGTGRYDKRQDLTEKQKEGLMSGIVFTEIDHNYVNPATYKHAKLVDSIFSNRSVWAQRGDSDLYGSSESVFNEYMTHAAFCLYVLDTYEKSIADFVIDDREELMVNRRNFVKFKEFDRELIRLRQAHKDLKVVELYPMILEWCKQQI
ncbi:MAG TPA: DUF4932 domain-containing protein [Daejeonella sp.]|nr:DUF4932 domain-containing protein [Daejeonella sp.]